MFYHIKNVKRKSCLKAKDNLDLVYKIKKFKEIAKKNNKTKQLLDELNIDTVKMNLIKNGNIYFLFIKKQICILFLLLMLD